MNADAWVSSSPQPMGFPEFVVVIASIMALNPLAMDMMLPALPNIASAFHITIANEPQAVLSTFLIGFGFRQFIMGPLSDRFGRRPVLIDGMALYCIASLRLRRRLSRHYCLRECCRGLVPPPPV
jgi:DHA1 family bicyclomycin/chloramphenicol resistance-like MFS transporter